MYDNTDINNMKILCSVEKFILENNQKIDFNDTIILRSLEEVMEQYTYGWYVCDENMIEQLKSINDFKIYILDKIQ